MWTWSWRRSSAGWNRPATLSYLRPKLSRVSPPAPLLLALDGLSFSLGRIGLLDVFLQMFVVCAVSCLVVDRDLRVHGVENVFVASRVRSSGLEPATLGCPVWGYERDGVLRALCHAGSNLVPVNADEGAVAAWTEFAGPQRMCASIIGPSEVAMDSGSAKNAR